MHLTLLVPELIWPEPADQFTLGKLAAPGLEWLLAHARLDRQPRRAFENSLAECCDLSDAPFGALRLLGEGLAGAADGHWLCADPVHLRFHQERIVLADAGAQIVYVTKSGAKYHAGGCRHLSGGRIPIPLSEAARRYASCGVCDPPAPKQDSTPGRQPDTSSPDDPQRAASAAARRH